MNTRQQTPTAPSIEASAPAENPLFALPAATRAFLVHRFERALDEAEGHPQSTPEIARRAAALAVKTGLAPSLPLAEEHFREALERRDAALDAVTGPAGRERLKFAASLCGVPPETLLERFASALPALLAPAGSPPA